MITSLSVILITAVLYGVTMKIADLLDEHNLHWFRGDAIVFGILWGAFGSLLVSGSSSIANILLAMMLAYVIRGSLDYINHALAAVMIIITFLLTNQLDPTVFFIFFAVFLVFGSLRDYVGNKRKKQDWIYQLVEPAWYYVIPTAIYSAITNDWLVFGVFTLYRVSYNIIKYSFRDN